MSSRRGPLRNAIEFGAAILFEWVVQCITPEAARALGRFVGRAVSPFTRYPKRVRKQLRWAFPDWSESRVRAVETACFEGFLLGVVEVLRVSRTFRSRARFDEQVELRVSPASLEAARSGKGVLFVTAHLGNWELTPWIAWHLGIPMTSVARPLENPLLGSRLERMRRSLGQEVVAKTGALLALSRHLRRGRSVGLAVDQDAREEGIFVPFFGRPASTYDGIAALALRFGRPIVPGYVVRRPGGKFLGVVDDPIDGSGLPADPEEAKRVLTARMNERLEAYVRTYPEQWIWHYRRWKTRPPGEPSLGGPPDDL